MIIKKRKPKGRRLPNNLGSITKRSDCNRSRPYLVRVKVNGKLKSIGDAATYEQGLEMLLQYRNDPSLFIDTVTSFSDVYALMKAERFTRLAKTTQINYESAYKHCKRLYHRKFAELKAADLQAVVSDVRTAGAGYAMQKKVRQILHHMYSYALKYDIITLAGDYSRYVDIDQRKVKYVKKPFVTRQINRVKVLADDGNKWAAVVIMMIYSGVRSAELLALLKADVKLRQRYFIVRDSKTEAGKNRAVPISKKSLPYFEQFMTTPGKYLVENDGHQLTYHQFRARFDSVMDASRCKHTPHECRHTCATMLDNAGANDTAVKRILGHAAQGVTKGVYTHKALHELKKAIDLI